MEVKPNIGVSALEDKMFRSALLFGISLIAFLMLFDAFYTREYHSIIIEVVAALLFLGHLKVMSKRPSTNTQRINFSAILLVLVNLGWLTGDGIKQINVGLFFLCIALIIVINGKEIYPRLFVIVLLNLLFLFGLQYNGIEIFNLVVLQAEEGFINDFIIGFLMIVFGSALVTFLKVNYNKEREKLREANDLLRDKTFEISYQNDELVMSQEILDKTIQTLEEQRRELMEIKGSLEAKVQERTNDLLKVNERLLVQNQQLEQYAYITSHNLRAPIAQIKGLIHLLPIHENFDDLTKETLVRLNESAINLDKVFSDLSKIIKVEKGMQQPWESINFVDEILEVVGTLNAAIKEKNIRIEKPALGEEFLVKSLRPYVYSVFHNIIENAVKYADPKKEQSFIKMQLTNAAKFHKVSIIDNGIGIDMSIADSKIFQMYQRFNDTHPGQGFGLFLVKTQMEAMGGKVELESVFGLGTTFHLYFPKK
ncbi:MAG: HAMP domain-containing histidine kinase [Cyclobacteriaceae bacterium]|nr:HAMP domain-containing histidine kinase [Cyclobacteriaceae bacterium]